MIKDIKNILPGLLAATVVCVILTLIFGTCCPMRILTGLPCPACGTIRSLIALMRLDIRTALWYQPVLPLLICFFIFFCHNRYYRQQNRKKLYYLITVIIILTAAAVYFVRMHLYYPDRPPLEYTPNNIYNTLRRQ